MGKQYWVCISGDEVKLSPKVEFAQGAIEACFGINRKGEAIPAGTQKPEAQAKLVEERGKLLERAREKNTSDYDAEGEALKFLSESMVSYEEAKQKFLEHVALDPVDAVSWYSAGIVIEQENFKRAMAALRMISHQKMNPIKALSKIQSDIEDCLRRDHWRASSSCHFSNAITDSRRTAACRALSALEWVIGAAENRAAARLKLNLPPIDLEAPYDLRTGFFDTLPPCVNGVRRENS